MEELKEIFKAIDAMLEGAEIDYNDLKTKELNLQLFEDYSNTRIVNSFLFNYSKIQDKIGGKLFKKVLYIKKEIDQENMAMIDILNLLEQLEIIESVEAWEKVREIRNILSHEYPVSSQERIDNILLAFEGYEILKKIYNKLKSFTL